MSKLKKTWMPVIIVLVLAALILLLALIGSKFKDENAETLSETPAPTETASVEDMIKEMLEEQEKEKEKEKTPEPTKAPKSSGSKSSGSASTAQAAAPKETEDGSDIYRQWAEYGQRIQDGMKDAAENISGTLQEIGKPFTQDSDGGAILTQKEISDGVRGIIDGLTGGLRQEQDSTK